MTNRGTSVVILTHADGSFWTSLEPNAPMGSMQTQVVALHLREAGLDVDVMRAEDVDPGSGYWKGVNVLYPSSEDPGLRYKDYLADILVSLETAGAVPQPGLNLFFAHHNKSLMEMLRRVWLPNDPLCGPGNAVYSTFEELRNGSSSIEYPAFVKSPEGAGSSGVRRVQSVGEMRRLARRMMRSANTQRRLLDAALRIKHPSWHAPSHHRKRIIVQREIPRLDGDFKVLRYGKRMFALRRHNRKDGVTASGSGQLDFDIERYTEPRALLTYASSVAARIPSPTLSLDIAEVDGQFFLLEFQAVYFGPATMQWARRHWLERDDGSYEERTELMTLEEVYAQAMTHWLS